MWNNIENNKNGIRSKTHFNDKHRKCDFLNNVENNKNGIRSKTHFND